MHNQSQTQQSRQTERVPSTATALVSGTVSTTPSCSYCQQVHSSNNCKVVTLVEERKQILKSSGRCFTCLRKGHISRTCRSPNKCQRCGGRHHSSICMKNSVQNTTQQALSAPSNTSSVPSLGLSNEPTTNNPRQGLNSSSTAFDVQPSTALYTEANKTVLLQTALADIYDPYNPQSTLTVRVVLDSGSQHSYITTRTREALRLKSDMSTVFLSLHLAQREEIFNCVKSYAPE